jgi:hypothetical protein
VLGSHAFKLRLNVLEYFISLLPFCWSLGVFISLPLGFIELIFKCPELFWIIEDFLSSIVVLLSLSVVLVCDVFKSLCLVVLILTLGE